MINHLEKNYFIKPIEKTDNEYCLNKHLFDPEKSSPPNDFIIKLYMRISLYNSCQKEDNLIKK